MLDYLLFRVLSFTSARFITMPERRKWTSLIYALQFINAMKQKKRLKLYESS